MLGLDCAEEVIALRAALEPLAGVGELGFDLLSQRLTVRFDRERMASAAADELLGATDVADLLVRRGMPFREAHGVVGGLVREALERGVSLSELSREQLAAHSELLDEEFYEVLGSARLLESKRSEGGTASERVREQLAAAREELAGLRA